MEEGMERGVRDDKAARDGFLIYQVTVAAARVCELVLVRSHKGGGDVSEVA